MSKSRNDSDQSNGNDRLERAQRREAATRNILGIISQSREDERPVFDVVLRRSAELCRASMASLNVLSDEGNQVIKIADWGEQSSERLPVGATTWPLEADNAPSVCVREGRVVNLCDMAEIDLTVPATRKGWRRWSSRVSEVSSLSPCSAANAQLAASRFIGVR